MGVLGHQIKIEARHQILHQMNLPTICVCRTHRLNSNRIWSSQLKQTIARFDEKLATILIKNIQSQFAHRRALTTNNQTNGIHRTAFDKKRGLRQPPVWSDFAHEDREGRSPRGHAGFSAFCGGGNGHYAGGEFDFADLVLSTSLAQRRKPPKLVGLAYSRHAENHRALFTNDAAH